MLSILCIPESYDIPPEGTLAQRRMSRLDPASDARNLIKMILSTHVVLVWKEML